MAHFALICPPFYSHVRAFEAVAQELSRRGHSATFVLNSGAASLVGAGAAVETAEASGRGGRDLGTVIRDAARPNGPLGILRTVADTAYLTDELCRSGPGILRRIGADAVLGDQMEPAAGLLAEHLQLPLVSLAAALPIDSEPRLPLPVLPWPYDESPKGLKRNRGGRRVFDLLMRRQHRNIRDWAARLDLPPKSDLEDCLSRHVQITQLVQAFDFPRTDSGDRLRYVGPLRAAAVAEEPGFDFDPAVPLVFASFGTLQGHRLDLFRTIAKACRSLGVQLLVAHCGGLSETEAASIGATFVTDFAPQRAVLARADVCVTHAGLNTVLDSLEAGVPLLAIPIAFDQPGIGARIAHHGVGKVLSRRFLSAAKVEAALAALLGEPGYRERASAVGEEIRAGGGAVAAVDATELALAASPEPHGAGVRPGSR